MFFHSIQLLCCLFVASTLTSGYAAEYSNPIGMRMVGIPAGTFVMGACKIGQEMEAENKKRAFMGQEPLPGTCAAPDKNATDYESPQRSVTLAAFELSQTEVTLGQFKQFITAAKRFDLLNPDFMQYNQYGDQAPVVMVNAQDAQDFITWLNQMDGGGYRLPTEAEWEYACRAGMPTLYCGSNEVDAVSWHLHNAQHQAQPVASKAANALGLFDMSGNVLEWVQDCWIPHYRNAASDGRAARDCDDGYQVQRGGSWIDEPRYLRATARQVDSPGSRGNDIGFRVARTPQ
jgi:formylglycine-generating enzyme required for sulfatase activity